MSNTTKYMMPIFFIVVSVIYLTLALNLPKAQLGDPYGPLYFPIIIGIGMLLSSIVYFFNELRSSAKENENEDFLLLKKRRTLRLIISTLVLCLFYTIAFEMIGYILSTLLFLGSLLFIVNGKEKWISNLSVSILFTLISWALLTQVLGIYLP